MLLSQGYLSHVGPYMMNWKGHCFQEVFGLGSFGVCVCFRSKRNGDDYMACFRDLALPSSVLKLSAKPLNLYLRLLTRRPEGMVFLTACMRHGMWRAVCVILTGQRIWWLQCSLWSVHPGFVCRRAWALASPGEPGSGAGHSFEIIAGWRADS